MTKAEYLRSPHNALAALLACTDQQIAKVEELYFLPMALRRASERRVLQRALLGQHLDVKCEQRLGGLLKHIYRQAA